MISRYQIVILTALMIGIGFCQSGSFAQEISTSRNTKSAANKNRSLKRISQREIKKMAAEIDGLIESQLELNQQKFNSRATDATFLRRAYLDIIGRIPTLDESRKFLNSKSPNKRAVLVDNLLESNGYVSRQFNFWADVLRIKTKLNNNITGQPYIEFVKKSLRDNKPYDQFVRELISSSGGNLQKDNGAVGYYLRDVNMPEDNMSNTIRIFLGTRLECAQCHDHPFDKWTQRQYYEMVAFTGGMNYRYGQQNQQRSREFFRMTRSKDFDQSLRPYVRRMVLPFSYGVSGNGTGLARLPEGYLGKKGEEYEVIKAKEMFSGKALVDPTIPRMSSRRNKRRPQVIYGARQIKSREIYANWLTKADTPRFAKVIANRMWKQAMGLALIEPIDDISDQTVASNPKLMKHLTELMVQLNFDLKQYLRVIYNTRAYNANTTGKDIVEARKYNFPGPVLRRMSAEQIWDSLLTMTIEDVDNIPPPEPRNRIANFYGAKDVYEAYEKASKMSAKELMEVVEKAAAGGGRRGMMAQMQRRYSKEREMLNRERKELQTKLRRAQRQRNQQQVKSLLKQRDELVKKYRRVGGNRYYQRAADTSSPAPPGHFLREFGQSDRETIDNANVDPAVTQALSLMNGFVETRIANNPNTVLMKNAVQTPSVREAIESVYLTMLSRKPTASERRMWENDFKRIKNSREAAADLIWTLVNSSEFIFIR